MQELPSESDMCSAVSRGSYGNGSVTSSLSQATRVEVLDADSEYENAAAGVIAKRDGVSSMASAQAQVFPHPVSGYTQCTRPSGLFEYAMQLTLAKRRSAPGRVSNSSLSSHFWLSSIGPLPHVLSLSLTCVNAVVRNRPLPQEDNSPRCIFRLRQA